MKATIYRPGVETARHRQLHILFEEYNRNFEKLMARPSATYASKARKALLQLKKVAQKRGREILELYAPSLNIGKERINDTRKSSRLAVDKQNGRPRKKENSTTDDRKESCDTE